jgi:hypothetical protein
MGTTRARFLSGLGAAALARLLPAAARAATREQRQAAIRQMARQTLESVYTVRAEARASVAKVAGHAVLSDFGMKILIAGGGTGCGAAVKTASGKETFLRMLLRARLRLLAPIGTFAGVR